MNQTRVTSNLSQDVILHESVLLDDWAHRLKNDELYVITSCSDKELA
jgi:hypothetical protein